MNLDARLDKIAALMEERLGIRGDGFEAKFARAGRLLPRRLRREGALLVEARALAEHPKLARRVDARRLRRAVRAFERHLTRVDGAERRLTRWINWGAGIGLGLFAIAALLVAVMAWRGLV
ncbi:MAG: hypothetical protein KDK28_07860 [Maritimibacter sp.]|nr:hypothetical protein [Maritimibacter sp.]